MMKKILIFACFAMIFASCNNAKKEVAPDMPTQKSADSLKKDTVAVVEPKTEVRPAVAEMTVSEPTETKKVKAAAVAETPQKINVKYASFGSKLLADNALTKEQMMQKYASLKKGDTIAVKFKSKVKDVCKKKGCWMSMELPNNKEAFVRFKDYGFFVPMNADKSDAIVSGKAFIDVVSVEELKHYAKDGGKSQEEIDRIKEPKVTYAFTADGVLLQE